MKKIFALLMACAMTLSFAACGKEDAAVTEESTEATTEAATEASTVEETTEEPTEATEVAGDLTIGATLRDEFLDMTENAPLDSAQAYADALIANPVIEFMGATTPVEPGLLTGFSNAEITGFKEGVMFAPMIGTIPFVGYIFELEDGSDIDGFKTQLETSANMAWNVCTEADEMFIENSGNIVFFLMSPDGSDE